jgi:hypothetical protein
MTFPKSEHPVHRMSVEAYDPHMLFSTKRAERMAKRLIEAETRPDRDAEDVASAIERRWGIGFWQLAHLAKGRAKTCDIALFGRMRGAYIELCERQVTKLQQEIAIEKAIGDDTLEHLEEEARALAAKISARKAALR